MVGFIPTAMQHVVISYSRIIYYLLFELMKLKMLGKYKRFILFISRLLKLAIIVDTDPPCGSILINTVLLCHCIILFTVVSLSSL